MLSWNGFINNEILLNSMDGKKNFYETITQKGKYFNIKNIFRYGGPDSFGVVILIVGLCSVQIILLMVNRTIFYRNLSKLVGFDFLKINLFTANHIENKNDMKSIRRSLITDSGLARNWALFKVEDIAQGS